jgi:hypothetical protein
MIMNQFKKRKMVMLPTNEKASIGELGYIDFYKSVSILTEAKLLQGGNWLKQHLYILSDEEIKEDDWFYDEFGVTSKIFQRKNSNIYSLPNNVKKIIATTDKSLKIADFPELKNTAYRSLPQPSQQFIEVYIKAYNGGNPITEVLAEYEIDIRKSSDPNFDLEPFDKLKINPKDNTITIRRVKDNFKKEDFLNALHKVGLEENKNYSKLWKKIEHYLN